MHHLAVVELSVPCPSIHFLFNPLPVKKCVAATHKYVAVLWRNSEVFSQAQELLNLGGQILNLQRQGGGDRKFGGHVAGGLHCTLLALASATAGPRDDSASVLDRLCC